jgi:CzcA family heavy metal efflux pump
MMRRVVAWSLRFRFIVVGLAAASLFFGIGQVRDMPVDVFPEFAPPRVEIQTASVGLSSSEIETLVTIPLEQALQGIPGLDVMRSKSVPQLSSIVMLFEPGTDLLNARQLIGERLATVVPTLPSWSTPPVVIQPLSATSRTMKIGVSSDTVELIDLSLMARWKIRPRLLQVSGVANVAIWGQRNKMLHVYVEPERLAANGLTLNQMMTATADALDAGLLKFASGASVGTGGFVETPNQRLAVHHVQPIADENDLREVVVEADGTRVTRIGDVSDVVVGHQPMIGDAVINDGDGLLLIVEKYPWANTLEVTRGVEEALAALRPGLPGIEIDSAIFRPATFIEDAITNLSNALLLGCLLVVVVLVLFLYDWRTALVSVVAIPLSLMAAAMVLSVRDVTLNTMVLAGFVIAVGVVVDDAIIDVENIVRRLRQARREGVQKSTASVILEASLEVRSAIVYATLIDVVALVPVFMIGGLSGAFFQPLAISYALAVLASMLVALTVTPAMAYILLRNAPIERRESNLVKWLQERYGRILAGVLAKPRRAYVPAGVVVLAGAMVLPGLGQSLLPSFKERDFLMHWLTTPSTSHPEMVRITTAASKELRQIPGVRNFGAHIGQAMAADEVVGMYFGENWISVDRAVDYDDTVDHIQEVVDGYPGLQRDVQTYLKERIREVLTGSSEAITIRIFGPDLDVLRTKAEALQAAMEGIPGIIDLHVQLQTEIPQIDVEVELAAAERYGLKPGDVRRAASALIASEEVNDTYRQGKIFDVRIWGSPAVRSSVEGIRGILLDAPTGGQVRLDEVADVSIQPTPNVINREGTSRRIDVGANVEGRDLGAVVRDVEAAIGTIDWPLEYHPELIGEYAERQAASDRLMLFAIGAAIGILLLLQAAFGSTRLALVSFVALPSALIGGILAASLGGAVISLGSLVGFFTVLGIAARNGIMLINHYQHLERFEGEPFGVGLVIRGARERLSPILMTALATGLALVPLVIAGDLPGHEIEHPMAVVILGGLVTSTLLNLFLVPVLYLKLARPQDPGPATSTTAVTSTAS